jgi:hypothetical protein
MPLLFDPRTTRIYKKLKALGGVWDKEAKGWQMPDGAMVEAEALLAALPPPKPKIPEAILHARRVVEAAELLLREAQHREHSVKVNLVLGVTQDVNVSDLEFGYHECRTSPTTLCVYDTHEDPRQDDCLFCHEPRDRG